MDTSSSTPHQQDDGDSHNNPDISVPQSQQQPEPVEDDQEENSDWETESSEGNSFEEDNSFEGDNSFESEDEDGDGDDEDDEDLSDMEMDIGGMTAFFLAHGDPGPLPDIELITPFARANRRPNLDEDEDVMSEFSGDEKYEIKGNPTDEPGKGDCDMVDISNIERRGNTFDGGYLTSKIRQLMLKLTKGRRSRERKLKIGGAATLSPSTSSSSSASESRGTYLHRLIVRGQEHPQEVEHSPAASFHFQCANSLCITPSAMGVWDDIFTISVDSIMRCGILDRMDESRYHSRLMETLSAFSGESDDDDDEGEAATRVHLPYAQKLKTVKATKFLKSSLYRFDRLPEGELYVSLRNREDPLCMAHKYGYLVMGLDDGSLGIFCTNCEGRPREIHNNSLSGHSLSMTMLNSVQIVRWPRYHRSRVATSDDELNESRQDEEEYDEKDGYPSMSGQYDHYLIMTGNEKGLFIVALPDHVDPNILPRERKSRSDGDDDFADYQHIFKYKEDNTWIRNGFNHVALNDAKASPNGQWIAVVGDTASVWIIEVSHVPETEEQRIARLEKEHEQASVVFDSDSEYLTEDSISETEDDIDMDKKTRGGEDDKKRSGSFSEDRPTRFPRLLRQFGQPIEMAIPDKILFPPNAKRPRSRWLHHRSYSSQYVAWNSTSTKLAHSSDLSSRVVVWSMPAREIICCVDTGGASFSIEFHPKLENLFSICNWYGFVHVVDITGCCVGDENLIPGDGLTEDEPGLAGCNGPHYEEKHDILMLSFRGETDKSLRILDGIRGMGWSTNGQYLYVATLRRVLRYELADERFRVPSLFEQCARKVREWKERTLNLNYTNENPEDLEKEFSQMAKDWEYVPYDIKRRIWGDVFKMRSHDE
ncbi:hypothetical protein BGZ80_005631 [Entomortierella chlamydospora]|uniref:Uncharacterized protein n=1 Tax=Entomortierella chlamydospora TaxID=101097 RepID=A0A9P6MJ54_9FUNG|nr:hypothetical protein BGZ79_006657 [Entomortierella chlamydospora]KAG0004352.1 hypothetical protein BGZ80_005631 [Entomortierella chlamydospora]